MDHGICADKVNLDTLVSHHEGNEASVDLLARRVKNRERQRRYRARKRQEADLKKATTIHGTASPHLVIASELQPVPLEPDSSLPLTSSDSLTRVYSPRNWKKDARRGARCSPDGNETPAPGAVCHDQLTSHSNTPLSAIGTTRCLLPSRRHWKAEARNKKLETE